MGNTAKKQHEEFEIKSDSARGPKKVVRQDRFEVDELDCFLHIGQNRYKVINVSPFGIAFRTDLNASIPNHVESCLLSLDGIEICDVHLRIARRFQIEPDTGEIFGAEVIGEPIPLSRVLAVRDANALVSQQKDFFNKMNFVPAEFRRRVFEIKDWLEQLQSTVNEYAKSSGEQDSVHWPEYEAAFVQIVGSFLTAAMPAKNEALVEFLPKSNDETLKASIEFFRQKLYDLIYQAPFANRVYHKPLGYAGDYEMMNIIYREKEIGETLFAKCLNHYWVSEPAAQAVRNRADYLIGRIRETFERDPAHAPSFLSVACGPAKEWQRMVSEIKTFNGRKATVHLLDQDERALKHAQRQMKTLSHGNQNQFSFDYLNNAIKNIIARGLEPNKYDLIYSAGLFDYFSDPVAQMAAMRLFASVKPGGRLIIGNFNVTNPNSMMMNLALDWHLIYRSEEELKRLFEPLGGTMRIDKESLDINLFCVIEKK